MKSPFSTTQHLPQQNSLLGALSAADCEHLAKDLELVALGLGEVLYESGETMSHAYFPIDGIISLLYVMKNGEPAEIAIGEDGNRSVAVASRARLKRAKKKPRRSGVSARSIIPSFLRPQSEKRRVIPLTELLAWRK